MDSITEPTTIRGGAHREAPARRHVPVSMGSPRFRRAEPAGFLVTDIWFPPRTVIPHHTHARPVLGVMLEGGFEDTFSRRTIEPTAGHVFTEPGEEGHANRVGGAGARVLVLQPDPGDRELLEVAGDALDEIGTARLPAVVDAAWRLTREIARPDDLSDLAMEALALEMLVSAGRSAKTGSEPGWLRRVDEMIGDGFRTPLHVADIADEVGVHRGHLARVYREHRGLAVSDHIRRLRLAWAAERLADSHDEVSSIAIRAGFADQSHLTRAFTRRFGVPPARYRDLHGAGKP